MVKRLSSLAIFPKQLKILADLFLRGIPDGVAPGFASFADNTLAMYAANSQVNWDLAGMILPAAEKPETS